MQGQLRGIVHSALTKHQERMPLTITALLTYVSKCIFLNEGI